MRADDIHLLVELNNDVEVMKYISGRASSAEESATELRGALGTRWLVFARTGDEFLGWVGAVPVDEDDGEGEFDIGWRFRRACWGQGYASEAATALVDQLFVHGARRVFAQTMAVNARSRAVMERIGLQYTRTLHLHFENPLPGTEHGEVEYELTRGDWEQRP